jgi:hypothetical protein
MRSRGAQGPQGPSPAGHPRRRRADAYLRDQTHKTEAQPGDSGRAALPRAGEGT